MKLTIVEGKLSDRYNHFRDFDFEDCIATDTRLMGVVALKLTWKGRTRREGRLYQLIHLDFSEFGVDDYLEFFTDPALSGISDVQTKMELDEEWERISGSLGGREVSIPLEAAMSLIEAAVRNNEQYTAGHDPELQAFRKNVLLRVNLMKEAAPPALPIEAVLPLVTPKKLSAYEVINYFLMRLCDRDFTAASYLSELEEQALAALPAASHGLMTLIRNQITRDKTASRQGSRPTYSCRMVAEEDWQARYRLMTASVSLTASGTGPRRYAVSGISFGNDMALSEFEAAMQMKQGEYITVYRILIEPEEFDLDESAMARRSTLSSSPNGALYMLYNQDNSHVDTDNYYMNHDLYGAYLVSVSGELVLMSSELMKITMMEMDLESSMLFQNIEISGRYKFDTQVFQSFSQMSGALFQDIIK